MMRFFFSIIVAMMAVSCVFSEEMHDIAVSGHDLVQVPLSLDVAQEVVSGPDGRAVMTKSSQSLKNLWVVQYDGDSDDACVVGQPLYLENPADLSELELVASTDNSTIFFLANTSNPNMTFPQGTSLGALKARSVVVNNESQLLASDGDAIFVGEWTGVVSEGSSINCSLIRNIAKASINIVPSDGITVQSWQLMSVPAVSYYYTSFDADEMFPAQSSLTLTDYPLVDGSVLSKDVYLPVNQRGVVDNVASPAYKNHYAPEGATYLQINARCDGIPVIYKFYLGSDFTSDFNIRPNHQYTYTFRLSDIGDPGMDMRVSYPELVDYSTAGDEEANCYILNPGKETDVYYRIPVKRVDEFWGGKNGYENVPAYTLGTDKPWKVEIISTNFNNSGSLLRFVQDTGVGTYDSNTADLSYFEVAVKPGTMGSAIVAIRRTDVEDAPVLWSWHLWITDYAPDEAFYKDPQAGKYAYKVTGGYVHRYKGAIWDGEYAGRFIMDRNLGAFGNRHRPMTEGGSATDGSLYFQFGRKDPVWGGKSYGYVKKTIKVENLDDSQVPPESIVASIQNPMAYMSATGWTAWSSNNKYNPTPFDSTIQWMDPNTSTKQHLTLAKDKSIFDPCPPGYCVPKRGIWDDFRDQSQSNPTTNINSGNNVTLRDFPDYNSAPMGLYYWPYPEDGMQDKFNREELVYYPATGLKQPGGSDSNGTTVYCLSANPASNNTPYSMSALVNALRSIRADVGMNMAQPVRCITIRDSY